MFHGCLVNLSFLRQDYPEKYKIINKKVAGNWIIYCIEIDNGNIPIAEIQNNMVKNGEWYCHFYNDYELYVIFREKYFKVKTHKSTWNNIVKYGESIGIPSEQLDFWPNRFQDEIHYFN